MNFYLDYNTFINKLNDFKIQLASMDQNVESNRKLFKAVSDTIDFFKSVKELNQEEYTKYGQIIEIALASSFVQNSYNG